MEDNHTDTVKSRDIEIKERKNVSILRRSNLEKYLSVYHGLKIGRAS